MALPSQVQVKWSPLQVQVKWSRPWRPPDGMIIAALGSSRRLVFKFHDALHAIDSLAGLEMYLTGLFSFCDLRVGFVERQETILRAGALVWSFSPASDAADSDELSLNPYAE